jgi:acyl-CoA synthetase (AMP-forming)/AMP-acid ligase II
VIELLQRAAAVTHPRAAIITNDSSIDYPSLLASARTVGAELVRRGIARFGVADHDAAHVVALLAGASLVGVEACVYPPVDTGADLDRLATAFDHDVLVSDRGDISANKTVLRAAELSSGPVQHDADSLPQQRPLLVLTTGTTGQPRAVRQDWSRVLRPFLRVSPAPEEKWLLAYGLHQFGGLQLLLHVMGVGATLAAPVPRRPREGLAAMRAHGIDHASATPTYWRFLLAELGSDGGPVPPLEQITLGGEAVPARLLDSLKNVFPDARISQIYAANESGALRSVRDGRNGLPVSMLDDTPDADIAVKIEDGELWVRSRIGMLGYYGDPPIDPDAWRATGDLVEIVGDRIMFRGRKSEVINVGGVKVHPLPVEERVSAIQGVEMVRAFGRPNPISGAILALEIVTSPGADKDEVAASIRKACRDFSPAEQPRSIRFVEAISTVGNKMSRRVSR